MKDIFRHIGLAIGLVLLLSLIIPLLPVGIITMPTGATVGYTSINITAAGYYYYSGYGTSLGKDWETMRNISPAHSIQTTLYETGFASDTSTYSGKWLNFARQDYRFDLSSIPVGAQVVSASIWTYQFRLASPYYLDDYVYLMDDHPAGSAPAVGENLLARNIGIPYTAPYSFAGLPAGAGSEIWTKHTVFNNQLTRLLTPDSGNYTFVQVMLGYDRYDIVPTWHETTHTVDSSQYSRLEITYATPAVTRTMNVLSNAADYAGILTGSENVSSISWLTPRAAFADDINGMGWRFEGSPGAAFNYSVSSDTGELIISGNNTIKSNGYYYLYATVPVTWEGWLRAKATDALANTRYSFWGRVELPPNVNQRLLTVSALDTEYPQYDYEFSRYVIFKNGIGYLYWKTNLEAADMANYHIKLMAGGDQANATSWNATMQYLNDYYFFTKDSDNYDMAHWRYLAFTPYITTSGFNTYDGFIINAAQDYSLTQTGFWQGSIRRNSDNATITYTDSAYFYLNDISQGVSITLDGYKVATSSEIQATVNIGEHSKVATRLRYLKVTLFDDYGVVAGSGTGYVSTGSNKVTFSAPLEVGSYQARFEFYDDTLVPDYRYIKDVAFTVVAPGAAGAIPPGEVPGTTGFFAWLNALLDSKGMNNAAGHWIIIILLCVLVAAIIGVYGKMPLVATVIDILIFGIAIYIKWIDPWIIALLAMAAGFTIYRLFKKNTGEQKEV